MNNELLPIVNEEGCVTGHATRQECHSGSMLLHPVVHLHILRSDGCIFLQRRSLSKDIQPGKWDTAVGGHVDYGETVESALYREVAEELGLKNINPQKLTSYKFQSAIEAELVNTFYIIVDKNDTDFNPVYDPKEIDDVRFWHYREIEQAIRKNILTQNFEMEYNLIKPILIKLSD